MDTKILAMYLPQFHRVPENDEWWGEGFTEWTAVQEALPLFEGHQQPRVPLDENYYNLLDKKTMEWQANLLKEYGIDGFVFYHYYFAHGKKILEKPIENLLKWKDININYCFSWANESWVRSWSKLKVFGNAWSPLKDNDKTGKQVLLFQEYGNKAIWKEHFEYLLPFFRDERYIKIQNKPVFMIWRPEVIFVLRQMVEYWQKLAVENGFNGIYFISTNVPEKCCDAVYYNEPINTMRTFSWHGDDTKLRRYQYADFLEKNINRIKEKQGKSYLGVFPRYDDSPRNGVKGRVVEGSTSELFKEYFKSSLKYSLQEQKEFLFINAWNEWGEGMYLEPDTQYNYKYLEAIRDAKNELEAEQITINPQLENKIQAEEKHELTQLERYRYYWKTFDRWLLYLENGFSMYEFIKEYGYKRIGLYGMGMFARHIINELPEGYVVCGIDKNIEKACASFKDSGIVIYSPADDIPELDAIIVTASYDFDDIYTNLKDKVNCDIHSLEEVFETFDMIVDREK